MRFIDNTIFICHIDQDMIALKKVLFLSVLIILVIFIGGLYLGALYSNFILRIFPSVGSSQHYINNLVQKNRPFLFSTQVVYRGTLMDISDKNVILLDDHLKQINIPLPPEINKLLTYSKLLNQQTSVSADKSELTSGQKAYVTINIDSSSNKIRDFNIRIDPRR